MSTQPPPVAPAAILRIVLTGFMGAGKSTLGAVMAAQLGWRFIDVDDELVHAHGASIARLFEKLGEPGFRSLEEDAVAGSLARERVVLALGGGALESQATRQRLLHAPATHIIFLEVPLDIALARCAQQSDGVVRPVLGHLDHDGLLDRYTRRLEHYRQAHRTLDTVNRTPLELARLLLVGLVTG